MRCVAEETDISAKSRAFIAAAFEVLTREHVIPTPIHHPYIAVGRDYFGGSVMGLVEFKALDMLLNQAHPERFADPLTRAHAEFASSYVFSLLEACVARCARDGNFDADSGSVIESVKELGTVLATASYEVVCCRHVTHLTTASGQDVEIGDITVVPEPEGDFDTLTSRLQQEISGAPRAWNRDDPRPYGPPHSLLVAREATEDPNIYGASKRVSDKVERFLLIARLLTAGTTQSTYEVSGTTTLVARLHPRMRTFVTGPLRQLVRRTIRLTGDEGTAFAALGDLIDTAEVKREGMAATSFDVALSKFNISHSGDSPYEHLVDLATALEAVFLGGDKETEGLTLRLRNRAAALLVTDDDPASALYDDVGQLYALRSKLVHGGRITQKELRKIIARISTVPANAAEQRFGVALEYAIDRMRDLVRRAILARLCLAEGAEPRWPFDGNTVVDAILADDEQRAIWRAHWHERLAALGVGDSTDKPRSAVDFISQGRFVRRQCCHAMLFH